MRMIATLAVALWALTVQPQAQLAGLFGCSTGDSHERWDLKKRKKPASLAEAKAVSIAQILDWKIPAGYKKS